MPHCGKRLILMFRYLQIIAMMTMLAGLGGCAGLVSYVEDVQKQFADMQKQSVADMVDFEQSSVNFRPNFQLEQPKREQLRPGEQHLVGAPPPPAGTVLLDGTRYYSANGHVCHYLRDKRTVSNGDIRTACYINGRWEVAAPVLNSPDNKP